MSMQEIIDIYHDIGILYSMAYLILVSIAAVMFVTAWWVLLGPRMERFMGYQVRNYGSQMKMGLWMLAGGILLANIDYMILQIFRDYANKPTPLQTLNFIDDSDISGLDNPFILAMKVIGAYLIFIGFAYLGVNMVKATGKSMTYGALGAIMVMGLGAAMVAYH